MQVSRILPDLQCSLLCEDVRQEVTGNFIALGIIGAIRVPKVPVVAGKLCVFTRWVAGVGEFHENIRLIAPDQESVIRKCETKFVLKDPAHHATNIAVFAGTKFEVPGIYTIEVVVDEVMKLRYPLPVMIVEPPPGAKKLASEDPEAPKENI
ncbi:MAG: hypothetical protein VX413_05890 [Verrucomicrobiota bacterium]|jgi:hypothetical protein|nr:hypothetical protein [Verrucomicrobiota bacterium]MEE2942915.1 hypothetical protein [Verrucomicrobiota bacterium]